jgi:hypothetical protein
MTPKHPFFNNENIVPPFSVVVERHDVKPNGDFHPRARIRFGPELRSSEFLRGVAPEEFKTLFWVLSFVTSNGECSPSLFEVSQAMGVSPGKAQARLERLLRPLWQGEPLLVSYRRGAQLVFSVSPAVIAAQQEPPDEHTLSPPPLLASRREAVVARSRAAYTRPRAEVESEIARLNGWAEPPFDPQAEPTNSTNEEAMNPHSTSLEKSERSLVKDQLHRVGLTEEQSEDLLNRFDLLRIRRQISWLNYHPNVRNRVGFLIAAIEDNYEAPLALRPKRAAEEKEVAPVAPTEEEELEWSEEDLPTLDAKDLFEQP